MQIQEILGYLLGSSSKLVKRTMDSCLSKYSITTSQWAVLKLLDTKTQLTQSQIAAELLGDKATAGEVILRLTDKGYLTKSFSKKDRRAYLVSLTPKAKDAVKDIESMVSEVTDHALTGFTEDEKRSLYKYLNKIIDNLKGDTL